MPDKHVKILKRSSVMKCACDRTVTCFDYKMAVDLVS